MYLYAYMDIFISNKKNNTLLVLEDVYKLFLRYYT